jgi:hypothetical protein
VGSLSGSRTFKGDRNPRGPGSIEVGECVQYPARTVKVAYEHSAGVPLEQRVEPDVTFTG